MPRKKVKEVRTMIVNQTDLPFTALGMMIDKILEELKGEDLYYGRKDYFKFNVNDKVIYASMFVFKKYTEWLFENE